MSYDFGAEADLRYLVHKGKYLVPLTYACWFYITDVSNPYKVLMMTTQADTGARWLLLNVSTDIVGEPIEWHNRGPGADPQIQGGAASINTWHHACATDTGSAQELWLDGASVATSTTTEGTDRDQLDLFCIGADGGNGVNKFAMAGFIAEPGVWNRVISSAEIQRLAAGLSPAFFSSGLVVYLSGGAEQRFDIDPGFASVGDVRRGQHPNIRYPVLRRGVAISPAAPAPAAAAGPVPKKWMHYARMRRTA